MTTGLELPDLLDENELRLSGTQSLDFLRTRIIGAMVWRKINTGLPPVTDPRNSVEIVSEPIGEIGLLMYLRSIFPDKEPEAVLSLLQENRINATNYHLTYHFEKAGEGAYRLVETWWAD